MKLKRFAKYDLTSLSDYWLATANEIESALIQAGVTPNNYTAKELFELAKPFVLARHNFLAEGLSICTSWPDSPPNTAAETLKPLQKTSSNAKWTSSSPVKQAPADQLIRLGEVENMVGVKKSSIYEMVKHNTFPAPHKLSRRAVAWSKNEVLAWINQRISG